MNPKTFQNLKQRTVVTGIGLVGLLLTLVLASYPMLEPLFVAIVAGVIGIALREYFQMVQRLQTTPVSAAAIFCSTVYLFAVYLSTQAPQWMAFPDVVLVFSFIAIFVHFFFKGDRPIVNLAVTVFGFVWITLPLAGLVSIVFFYPEAYPEDGRWWFFYLIGVTKMTDVGAFFVGKKFGRRKLAEKLSPQKTLEGAWGGIAAGVMTSLCFCVVGRLYSVPAASPLTLTFSAALGLGLLISIAGQAGDLAESLIKRDAGVKDSSELPGFGGVLDIVDSLLFTTPILVMFLRMR